MNLLEQTKQAFQNVRGSFVEAMIKLYQVKESGQWQSVASSWSEYVESELQISQSVASKLLAVHRHYLIEGGVSHAKLASVDVEKLYMASRLEGSVDEQLAKAQTLPRRDLRLELNDEEDEPHTHEPICRICQIRL